MQWCVVFSRAELMSRTHDVHVLPSFLRAVDFPRYLVYLVKSRGIETVLSVGSIITAADGQHEQLAAGLRGAAGVA